jgi:hypothetical protein
MKAKCPHCKGLGWVCENHPTLAWSKEIGCQCGPGMPCTCHRFSAYEEPDKRRYYRAITQIENPIRTAMPTAIKARTILPITFGACRTRQPRHD